MIDTILDSEHVQGFSCSLCKEFFYDKKAFIQHKFICTTTRQKAQLQSDLEKEIAQSNRPPGKMLINGWKRIKRSIDKNLFDHQNITWEPSDAESIEDVTKITILCREWVNLTYERKTDGGV